MFVKSLIAKLNLSPQMERWLIGAANAFISGATAGFASLVVHVTFKQGAVIVLAAAGVSFKKWLAQHPLEIPEPVAGQ